MPDLIDVSVTGGHRFQLRRFAAPAAGAQSLLWLPALGVPAAKYDVAATALAASGLDVVVHEWRGGGSSSLRAARGCDWGYRELLSDLEATLDATGWDRRHLFAGHSLGGQFAALLAAREPAACAGLVLVAAGVPAPETFTGRHRIGLAVLARIMPLLVAPLGYFPGQRLRFAGREAAGVMRDWAASARTGGYRDYGDGRDHETLLAALRVPALALAMAEDWMAPVASLHRLLEKLGGGAQTVAVLDGEKLGVAADHFRWMRTPAAVVARIAGWRAALSP